MPSATKYWELWLDYDVVGFVVRAVVIRAVKFAYAVGRTIWQDVGNVMNLRPALS
jgi:hypothetical protein